MKNKEIEEILNYMKQYVENKYEHDSEPMLNHKDLQIVLSYIKQLENNRDKAIEVIDLITPELWNISNKMTYRLKDIKYILNGDSE